MNKNRLIYPHIPSSFLEKVNESARIKSAYPRLVIAKTRDERRGEPGYSLSENTITAMTI